MGFKFGGVGVFEQTPAAGARGPACRRINGRWDRMQHPEETPGSGLHHSAESLTRPIWASTVESLNPWVAAVSQPKVTISIFHFLGIVMTFRCRLDVGYTIDKIGFSSLNKVLMHLAPNSRSHSEGLILRPVRVRRTLDWMGQCSPNRQSCFPSRPFAPLVSPVNCQTIQKNNAGPCR
jgi:hypothetical protein